VCRCQLPPLGSVRLFCVDIGGGPLERCQRTRDARDPRTACGSGQSARGACSITSSCSERLPAAGLPKFVGSIIRRRFEDGWRGCCPLAAACAGSVGRCKPAKAALVEEVPDEGGCWGVRLPVEVKGLGIGVRIQNLRCGNRGLRIHGFGLRGFGFRIWGLGFGAPDVGVRVEGFGLVFGV